MRPLFAALTLLLGLGGGLLAHEWYEPQCCSGNDCRELADDEVPLYVRPLPDGKYFIVKWNREVERRGYSPDNKFHICETAHTFYCLYTPLPSGS